MIQLLRRLFVSEPTPDLPDFRASYLTTHEGLTLRITVEHDDTRCKITGGEAMLRTRIACLIGLSISDAATALSRALREKGLVNGDPPAT